MNIYYHFTQLVAIGMLLTGSFTANASKWTSISCSDAGYSGRQAFTCETMSTALKSQSVTGVLTLNVWATPKLFASIKLSVDGASAPIGKDQQLYRPLLITVDGRTIGEFKQSDLIKPYFYNNRFSTSVPITENMLKQITSGNELHIEFMDITEKPYSIAFNSLAESRSILDQLVARTQSGYRDFYSGIGQQEENNILGHTSIQSTDLWKGLGEAADRSRYWITSAHNGDVKRFDFKWIEQDKDLLMIQSKCSNGSCVILHNWTIRLHAKSIVNNQHTPSILLYNELKKPISRYIELDPQDDPGTLYSQTFDPILEADMLRSVGSFPSSVQKSKEACCIIIAGKKYRTATSADLQALSSGGGKGEQGSTAGNLLSQPIPAVRQMTRAEREAEGEEWEAEMLASYNQGLHEQEAKKNEPSLEVKQERFLAELQKKLQGQQDSKQSGIKERENNNSLPIEASGENKARVIPAAWPLSFTMFYAMQPGPKATANPNCFSRVLTLPAPPAYGTLYSETGSASSEARAKARQIVESYLPQFKRKCEAASDGVYQNGIYGTPSYTMNDFERNKADNAFAISSKSGANDVVVSLETQ